MRDPQRRPRTNPSHRTIAGDGDGVRAFRDDDAVPDSAGHVAPPVEHGHFPFFLLQPARRRRCVYYDAPCPPGGPAAMLHHLRRRWFWLGLPLLIAVAGRFAPLDADAAKPAGPALEKKARAILRTNCYRCHSHQAGKSKGGLVLDSRASCSRAATTGRRSCRAIPRRACSIKAILHDDPDLKMPRGGEAVGRRHRAADRRGSRPGRRGPRRPSNRPAHARTRSPTRIAATGRFSRSRRRRRRR